MRAEGADEEQQEIEVTLGPVYKRQVVADKSDAFLASADEINKYEGLGPNFRRKNTRALQKVHAGQAGAKSKKTEYVDNTGYNLFGVVHPPYNLDYLAKIHEINPAHYAASWAKTSNIVGLGYDFELSDKTKMSLEAITDEAKLAKVRRKLSLAKLSMVEWLQSCHDEDDFLETLKKAWLDYEVTGNGFIEVGRTVTGDIGYIGHIPATTMRVRKDRDGFVQIVYNKVVFFRNYGDQKTKNPLEGDSNPNEVIHLKKYSPTNGFYGIPDIISATSSIAGTEFANRFNLDYFENKAVPRYVIVVKGGTLSPNAQAKLLAFFETGLKGNNHRTIYIPLPADRDGAKASFEMNPVEAGIQDSSFNNYRKDNIADILMAHRVPITKVSMADAAALAVAKDADKTFKEQVCQPEQRVLENKLNKIISTRTDVFVLRLTQLTLTDESTQSQIDERDIRNQILTPNEIRTRRGMPGREGGDEPVKLGAQQQADQTANATQNRARDRQRANAASDTGEQPRAPKGEGRQAK